MLLKELSKGVKACHLRQFILTESRRSVSCLHRNLDHNVKESVLQYCTCAYHSFNNFSLLKPQTIMSIQCAGTSSKPANSETDETLDPDNHIRPALDAHTPVKPSPVYVNIVPGKGPPPEPPIDCCMSGCANCVWIQYAEELKQYFSDIQGNKILLDALEEIDNPGLKMFLKMEMGLL